MQVDARVRAPNGIFYRDTGRYVPPNTCGSIRGVSHRGGIVAVLWDGDAEAVWTSYCSIELVPS